MKPHKSISQLRVKIDKADRKLIKILARRFQIVKKIDQLKRVEKLAALDEARFKQMIKERLKSARKNNLDRKFVSALFNLIHDESLRLQKKTKR